MEFFESRLLAGLGETGRNGDAESGSGIYLAAVSGGADSAAMLAGLAALREKAGFSLHCVHVEHGIRPAGESRGDARAVEALCEKLGVTCGVISIPPGRIAAVASKGGPGIEGAARLFRYRALYREARRLGAARILTAHTRDDALETLLMRILRGSGPAGLRLMPRQRGILWRPLLDLGRRDVLDYLAFRGIQYRTDSTNGDIRYLRNRVRLKLIPLLDSYFPFWRRSLLALAETQALTAEFLADEVQRRLPWERVFPGENPDKAGELRLREGDFLEAPPIVREEALFAGADFFSSLRVSGGTEGKKRKLKSLSVPKRAAVRAASGTDARVSDLGPVRLRRRNGFIFMSPAPRSRVRRGFSLIIGEPGVYILPGRLLGMGSSVEIRVRAGIPESGKSEKTGFFAGLPLALKEPREGDKIFRGGRHRGLSAILDREARSGYTSIISACDTEGPAAFIGIRGGNLIVTERSAGAVTLRPLTVYFVEISIG